MELLNTRKDDMRKKISSVGGGGSLFGGVFFLQWLGATLTSDSPVPCGHRAFVLFYLNDKIYESTMGIGSYAAPNKSRLNVFPFVRYRVTRGTGSDPAVALVYAVLFAKEPIKR